MGIFSILKKSSHGEIYNDIASKIVLASLTYRTKIDDENLKLTAKAGAEFSYLLLHVVDRELFKILGEEKRYEAFDAIAATVIGGYCKSIMQPSTPDDVLVSIGKNMFDDMNNRQVIYSKCKSIIGDSFPSKGTMVFALGYFIHLSLGRTSRKDVDKVLIGDVDVTNNNNDAFPDSAELLKLSIYFGAFLKTSRLEKTIKRLL